MESSGLAEGSYSGFFDSVPLGLYRTTPEGEILEVNATFLELFRMNSRASLSPLSARDLYVDPGDRDQWKDRIDREGVVSGFITRLRRIDGDVFWARLMATAVRDGDGRVTRYEGAIEDITQQVEAEQRLAATEALLLGAIDQTPAGVLIADAPDVTIRVANRAALGIRGETDEDLTGIPYEEHAKKWQVFYPDGRQCPPGELPLTRAVRRGEMTRDSEFIIRTEDGEERWILANAAPVRDRRGEIVAGVAVFPDITERKRAEVALHRRDQILEAVSYAASCFLATAAWEDNIQSVLERFGRAADASRTYIFQAHSREDGCLLFSQRHEWVEDGIESFLDDPGMQSLDLREAGLGRWLGLLTRNQVVSGVFEDFPEEEQWLRQEQGIESILLVPVFVDDSCWGLIGFDDCEKAREWTTAEVGALRAAADTLAAAILKRQAEAERIRLAKAVEQVPESVVITDSEGTIQYVNPAFEQVSGYRASELIGDNPRMLKSGVHEPAFYESLWETIQSGQVWRGHFVNRRKDGHLYEEEATIAPVRNGAGRIVNYVGVKRDVTEQAFIERQLRQAQRMESLGHLAGGIAHDFNNVMGLIMGSAELLRRKLVDPDLKDHVDLILDSVKRGKGITGRMLAYSRSDEGQLESASVLDLLGNIDQVARHTFPKNIRVAVEDDGPDVLVRCDSSQVQQALMNLCLNAVDAMPDGGELRLSWRPADPSEAEKFGADPEREYACISVLDTGSGMDQETLASIFEPFYTKKPVGQGTGLGLYVVYGTARSHGGWVDVSSEVGEGTRVTLGLPIEPSGETAPDPAPSGRSCRESATGRHILVVDDEEGLLELLREVLEFEGYEVTTAPHGEAALEILEHRADDIDLMITDIGMPNMGGHELIEKVQEHGIEINVVVASGYMDDGQLAALEQMDILATLTKPFEVQEVVDTVAGILG